MKTRPIVAPGTLAAQMFHDIDVMVAAAMGQRALQQLVPASAVALCWTPHSEDIELIPWPDGAGRSAAYSHRALGDECRNMDEVEVTALLCALSVYLCNVDRMRPTSVHRELMRVKEYRGAALRADEELRP